MPYPLPTRAPSGPRRRSVLTGAAGSGALLLTGCTDGGAEPAARASQAERLGTAAAADSRALLARYDAVLKVHPGLRGLLAPLRAEVARHASVLGARHGAAGPTASASPSGSPSATAADRPEVPRDEQGARAMLAGAERKLIARRTSALADAPAELARLLASVAAAGAGHAYLLSAGSSAGEAR
ncbi:hypothetical protein [Streptomyces sp. NPDC058045]|uniref:hypothetical protein n=1 Tax=Streptomyces sp. NPDC058045 TaxID=3346311 RepID=UPI0036E28C91